MVSREKLVYLGMKDWQGNEIKAGDIVRVYMFLRTEFECIGGVVFESVPEHPEYIWELASEWYITDENITHFGVGFNAVSVNYIDIVVHDEPHIAICIKGKTDDRGKFMEKYFEV